MPSKREPSVVPSTSGSVNDGDDAANTQHETEQEQAVGYFTPLIKKHLMAGSPLHHNAQLFYTEVDELQMHGIGVADITKLKTAGICTVRVGDIKYMTHYMHC